MLVRILTQGQSYRVANVEEEVFELDERGEARRAMSLSAPSDG